uniref:Ribonuclease A-domain domain-containing protein n=1 Tax=Oryzias latipes TaxID=8090 RepID=A0A3P9J9T6_ORYLA
MIFGSSCLSRPMVCLLILMLFADSSKATYDTFRWQHTRESMLPGDCNNVMRTINNRARSCKDSNSFIVSTELKIEEICQGEGVSRGEMTLSKKTFRIVLCKLEPRARYPDCQYKGSVLTNRKLLVKCESRLPVHFHGDRN